MVAVTRESVEEHIKFITRGLYGNARLTGMEMELLYEKPLVQVLIEVVGLVDRTVRDEPFLNA